MDLDGIGGAIIAKNKIFGFRGAGGIALANSKEAAVTANLLAGNQAAGIKIEQSENIKILNNTIYGLGFWQTEKAIIVEESEKVSVFNNITMDILGYAIDIDESSSGSFVSDNNNLTGSLGVALWAGESFSGLSEYSRASRQDRNSFSQDPKFVNIFEKDFHLSAGSPLIDRGADKGVEADFDGVAIPQGVLPDIGAFEFVRSNR